MGKLSDFQVKAIKESLERDNWGWSVEYAPEHKDFLVSTDYEIKYRPFLRIFSKKEKIAHPTIIRKEDMKWEMIAGNFSNIFTHHSYVADVYIYYNINNKIILFR